MVMRVIPSPFRMAAAARRAWRSSARVSSAPKSASSSSTQLSCAVGHGGEQRRALRRQLHDRWRAGRRRAPARTTSPSATSRSMMPVTLPFETIRKRDSSLIVMPPRLAVERGHHVEPRQRHVEFAAQPLAQFGLDGARRRAAAGSTAAAAPCWRGRGRRRRFTPSRSLRQRYRLAGDRAAAAGVHSHSTAARPPPAG